MKKVLQNNFKLTRLDRDNLNCLGKTVNDFDA